MKVHLDTVFGIKMTQKSRVFVKIKFLRPNGTFFIKSEDSSTPYV